jgi:SAM-dependent methyltransferase
MASNPSSPPRRVVEPAPAGTSDETLQREVLAKNRAIYDHALGPFWQRAVYEPLHGGWELINLGGRPVLDALGLAAGLAPGVSALELCSGLGGNGRYLASRFGCSVTGVELNPVQVERAQALLARVGPEATSRIRFVEADVVRWQPDAAYDVVFTVDSLMLVPDLAGALATAYRALCSGGTLSLTEIGAGPALSARTRRIVWEEDGMITLASPAEYRRALEQAGFHDIRVEDRTDLAVESHQTMLAALRELAEAETPGDPSEGPEALAGSIAVTEGYHRVFARGELCYLSILARRP